MTELAIPYDLERVKKFLQDTGWVPLDVHYENGIFHMAMEKTKSAKIHIEYEDMMQEVEA